MSMYDDAMPLAHVIAEFVYTSRVEDEQSRRIDAGFDEGDIAEWSEFSDAERDRMARQHAGLAIRIQREGWVKQ